MKSEMTTPLEQLSRFDLCEEAADWLRPYKSKTRAWRECINGVWQLWTLTTCADLSNVDPKTFGFLVCDIAELAIPYAVGETPKLTITIARRFLRGEATREELEMAEEAAWTAGETESSTAMKAAFGPTRTAAWAAWGAAWAAANAAKFVASQMIEKAGLVVRTTFPSGAIEAMVQKKIADSVRMYFPKPPRIKHEEQK